MLELLKVCFQLLKFTPNREQLKAINHTLGPLLVIAAPGSGKTRVLLWRAVYLIVCNGVNPAKIFISTFTTEAAYQLRNGLNRILGIISKFNGQTYDLSEMYIGTVHSLCQRMLRDRRFTKNRNRGQFPTLIDEVAQYQLIRSLWNDFVRLSGMTSEDLKKDICNYFHSYPRTKQSAISNLIAIFNRWSEELLTIPELRVGSANDQMLSHLVSFYDWYLHSLQKGIIRKVDFALLQQETLNLLTENEHVIYEFDHILVDEYQDSNLVQELIFFRLAEGSKNIFICGDDDQSLYRFRGASVEGFTKFPERCEKYLGISPEETTLNINYRSKAMIVDTYNSFMRQKNWATADGLGSYRLDKNTIAHSVDNSISVIASSHTSPDLVAVEIAQFIRKMIDSGSVADPNQIAILFPSLKGTAAQRIKAALEEEALEIFAPRANHFFEGEIPKIVSGLFLKILGRPKRLELSGDYGDYQDWLDKCENTAEDLLSEDPLLQTFVKKKRNELHSINQTYSLLIKKLEEKGWSVKDDYLSEKHEMELETCLPSKLKTMLKRKIGKTAQRRKKEGMIFTLSHVINRLTSVDWTLLDLFYQLWEFSYFKEIKELATSGDDEKPMTQLRQISTYLSRFMNQYNIQVLYGGFLQDEKFIQVFFSSYLYSLFLMRETELEDKNNPFPKGKIPLLTIHQAKGLEFEIVVLGSTSKRDMGPPRVEEIVRPLLNRPLEPLNEIATFDAMRMFYVALSRAKSLLVLAHPRGPGISTFHAFKQLFSHNEITRIPEFDIGGLPVPSLEEINGLPKVYSFTSDFLLYEKCPHLYMISRKYEFVPSRSQTMFFGSLVHRVIEDLHNRIMYEKNVKN